MQNLSPCTYFHSVALAAKPKATKKCIAPLGGQPGGGDVRRGQRYILLISRIICVEGNAPITRYLSSKLP